MRILIANDDGIEAKGIHALWQAAAKLGDVVVVAPNQQRSASSHGISIHYPLYAKEVDVETPGVKAWSLTGTPVDCVKWAIACLGSSEPFDLMISGINEGANLATDVLYSGTLAAAGEAALQHVPAIAFSAVGPTYPYEDAAKVAMDICEIILRYGLEADTFLNVNFPDSGILTAPWAATQLGARGYQDKFAVVADEEGRPCYQYAGEALNVLDSDDTDVAAIKRGDISISPLRYHYTHEAMVPKLHLWFRGREGTAESL